MTTTAKPKRWGANPVTGSLAAIVSLSYSVSYGALIFSGDALKDHLSAGLMSALVSAGIVAIVVALTSSFSFAIAGPDSNATAILAVMVSAIADATIKQGSQATMATVLMAVALSSVVCGVILFLLGYSKRGRYVRFIPFPVIGGFLAGTGYLLVDGAVKSLSGAHLLDPTSLSRLAQLPLLMWLPTVLVAVSLLVLQRRYTHFLIAPGVLAVATALFFAGMAASDISMVQAHKSGLLLNPVSLKDFTLPFQISLSHVQWDVILGQAVPLLALTVVVAITILLNATGLDLASAEDADFDQELKAAGVANVAVGLAGGIVGYLSISRSLLNLRAGATSRVAGISAGVVCLAVTFLMPQAFGYLPRPVLTGLVLYLGLDLLSEWVGGTLKRMPRFEYVLVLLILALIAYQGFLYGVLLGVVVASLLFVFNYSRLTPVKHTFSGKQHLSNVERTVAEANLLAAKGGSVYGLTLQGFIFFGTSNAVLDEIKERLRGEMRYVLVDFRLVQGLDVSAVLSFSKLRQSCEAAGVVLVLTELPESIRDVFDKAKFTLDDEVVRTFPDLDHGMEWIENQMLMTSTAPMKPGLRSELRRFFSSDEIDGLLGYLEELEIETGTAIAKQGDAGDTMWFVDEGAVSIYMTLGNDAGAMEDKRLRTYGPGTIIGEMGFYTEATRSASIVTDEKTKLRRLTRDKLLELERERPELAHKLHRYVISLLSARVKAANEEIRTLL